MNANSANVNATMLANVQTFRRAALNNGYMPIRVRSFGKAPVALAWTNGESQQKLLNPTVDAANTGLVLRSLHAIDVDIDDPQIAETIMALVEANLPKMPLIRQRPRSSRFALLYRAEQEGNAKRVVTGPEGSIEVLGSSQQLRG